MTEPARPTGRPRRSCLAVPGSNPRLLEKAHSLPPDQVPDAPLNATVLAVAERAAELIPGSAVRG